MTDNGALAGCRMSVAYDGGVTLHFMQLAKGALLIGVSDCGWSLDPNGTYGMNLSIDGRFVRRARGVVLDAMRDKMFVDLGRDRITRTLLQRGRQLSLADGKRTYGFRLTDTGAALERLASCARTGTWGTAPEALDKVDFWRKTVADRHLEPGGADRAMADLIDLESIRRVRPRYPAADGRVGFDKRELRQLFGLYSRRVMSGEWRDYAIDFGPKGAVFSVFRRAAEQPLFAIWKLAHGRERGRYVVAVGAAVLRRAHTLGDLLRFLDEKPRLVWSQG